MSSGSRTMKGRMNVIKRATISLLGIALIASQVNGQGISSKGTEFIAALREANGSKALQLIEESGFTIVNQ